MDIGTRIKKRRKELDMSVEELARLLGKNRATVYRYERGDIENLPMDILEPLAKALDTSPQYLLGWMSKEGREKGAEYFGKKTKTWYEEFGPIQFTDEEYQKIVEYTRFLLSQRENK